MTAWHGLVAIGHIKPGDTVLVMGSGGVSLFAIQISKMAGAKVIATSSSESKLERMIEMGASEGINYLREPKWGEVVRGMTGGRGVDHVVEVGGASTIDQSVRATRDGGNIASIGNLGGAGFASKSASDRGIRISEIAVGSREMTLQLLRAMQLNRQFPAIDTVFDFADLKEALAYLETSSHFGKIVVSF